MRIIESLTALFFTHSRLKLLSETGKMVYSKNMEYRVWDNAKKKMIYQDFPFNIITENLALKLDPKLEENRYFIVEGDFVFQKFSGFVDTNKEKIFEGDLIEIDYSIGEVFWSELRGSFAVRSFGSKQDWSADLFHYKTFCEVVGNIFESPNISF